MKVVADILPVAGQAIGCMSLEIVPDLLDGIEFRSITWEPLDMQARVILSQSGQVGVYMGYVTRQEHALVDVRLYLPKEWAKDKKRRKKCGVPKEIRYRTRHELALEMLATNGKHLPHQWI